MISVSYSVPVNPEGTEVRLGWHAGSGNTTILPRIIGYGNAARWILTGDRFDAADAMRVGLIQQIAPDADVESAATSIAEPSPSRRPSRLSAVPRAPASSRASPGRTTSTRTA